MRTKEYIVATAFIISFAACTPARKDSAAAAVIEIDNAPCFFINIDENNNADTIKLQQIQVVDSKGEKKWQVSFDKGAVIKKHQCFLYGRKTPGMLVEKMPAQLVIDEIYTAALIAPTENKPEKAFFYIANFCILSNNGNNTFVIIKEMPINLLPDCKNTKAS